MLEAARYSAFAALRDGRRVEIRALRPDDRAGVGSIIRRRGGARERKPNLIKYLLLSDYRLSSQLLKIKVFQILSPDHNVIDVHRGKTTLVVMCFAAATRPPHHVW